MTREGRYDPPFVKPAGDRREQAFALGGASPRPSIARSEEPSTESPARAISFLEFSKLWWLVLLLPLLWGCASTSSDSRQYSTLRLFAGVNPDRTGKHQVVPIYQRSNIRITVASEPFLDEGYVQEARIVETLGGFSVRVRYDRRGTGLLQNATHRIQGRHLAIQAGFPEIRWLASIFLEEPLEEGVLEFVPDATREEAERFVLGLNNVAKRIGNQPKR